MKPADAERVLRKAADSDDAGSELNDAVDTVLDVLLAIGQRHQLRTWGSLVCRECAHHWPCPTKKILDGEERG